MEADTKDRNGNPIGVRFNCKECTEADKKARGCDGGVKWYFDDLSIDHCPERLIDADMLHNIGIWRRYHLLNCSFPFSGGWAEMPAAILYLIELLEGEYNLYQQRMKDKR